MKTVLSVLCLSMFVGAPQAATVEDILKWASTYIEDLPNFICKHIDHRYERFIPDEDWTLKKWHEAEVRYIDGNTDNRVLTVDGKPPRRRKWYGSLFNYLWSGNRAKPWYNPSIIRLGSFFNHFGNTIEGLLNPEKGYQIFGLALGEDWIGDTPVQVFHVRADAGILWIDGIRRDDSLKNPREFSTDGKLWVEEETGRIRKIEYHVLIPLEDQAWGQDSYFTKEYEYFEIGGKSYLLPSKITSDTTFDSGRKKQLVVREFQDYRRFTVDTSIQFGGNGNAEGEQ